MGKEVHGFNCRTSRICVFFFWSLCFVQIWLLLELHVSMRLFCVFVTYKVHVFMSQSQLDADKDEFDLLEESTELT